MKRRKFLITMGLAPPALGLIGCNDRPSSPTTIYGRLIDENSSPVTGASFHLLGSKGNSGLGMSPIFEEKITTDSDGNYKISRVIGSDVSAVYFALMGNNLYNFDLTHRVYISENDGSYELVTSARLIQRKEYGKILNFNLKVEPHS